MGCRGTELRPCFPMGTLCEARSRHTQTTMYLASLAACVLSCSASHLHSYLEDTAISRQLLSGATHSAGCKDQEVSALSAVSAKPASQLSRLAKSAIVRIHRLPRFTPSFHSRLLCAPAELSLLVSFVLNGSWQPSPMVNGMPARPAGRAHIAAFFDLLCLTCGHVCMCAHSRVATSAAL